MRARHTDRLPWPRSLTVAACSEETSEQAAGENEVAETNQLETEADRARDLG